MEIKKNESMIKSSGLNSGDIYKDKKTKSEYIYIDDMYFSEWKEDRDKCFLSPKGEKQKVFYSQDKDEYCVFEWSNALKIEKRCTKEKLKKITDRFKMYPMGEDIKEVFFHKNHLNYQINLPRNIEKNKISIFYKSFLKVLDEKNNIYLVFNWTGKDVYPDMRKFDVFLIKITNKSLLSFEYIPLDYINNYKDILNVSEVEKTIENVKRITLKKRPLLFSISAKVKKDYIDDKIQDFQNENLGSIYISMKN